MHPDTMCFSQREVNPSDRQFFSFFSLHCRASTGHGRSATRKLQKKWNTNWMQEFSPSKQNNKTQTQKTTTQTILQIAKIVLPSFSGHLAQFVKQGNLFPLYRMISKSDLSRWRSERWTRWERHAIRDCVNSLLVTWLTKMAREHASKIKTQGVRVFDWISTTNRSCFSWFLVFLVFLSFLNLEAANSNNCPSESFLSCDHTWAGQVGTMVTINTTPGVCRNPRSPRICPHIAALLAASLCGRVWGWRPRRQGNVEEKNGWAWGNQFGSFSGAFVTS